MSRIVVCVQVEGEREHDIEVSTDLPSGQLAKLLVLALQPVVGGNSDLAQYIMRATPPGCFLQAHESLADVNVAEGATLSILRNTLPYFVSDSGRQYACVQKKMRIGRFSNNSATPSLPDNLIHLGEEINGNTVSRNHALVIYQQGKWYLSLSPQTENQTWLNDQRLLADEQYVLNDGDRVQFGGVYLRFHL